MTLKQAVGTGGDGVSEGNTAEARFFLPLKVKVIHARQLQLKWADNDPPKMKMNMYDTLKKTSVD